MKSFRNLFRQKNKENKENVHNESHHVHFDDIPKPRRFPQKRRNSITDLSHPTSAYHVPVQPSKHRTTRSCVDKISPDEPASSSDDDKSTLVAEARSFKMTKSRKKVRIQQKTTGFFDYGFQTSSEYGSGSPASEIYAGDYDHHRVQRKTSNLLQELEEIRHKYMYYKEKCVHQRNRMQEMKEQLDFYKMKAKENEDCREKNPHLQAQIDSLTAKVQQLSRQNNPYMPSAYPMLQSYQPLPFNIDAGEKLVSQAQFPNCDSATITSQFGNHFDPDEIDETKNFRTQHQNSSEDDSFQPPLSISTSSTEQARACTFNASPLHDRSMSLTMIPDDGYSTNQSNQALAAAPSTEDQATPVKPKVPRRKIVRFNSFTGTM